MCWRCLRFSYVFKIKREGHIETADKWFCFSYSIYIFGNKYSLSRVYVKCGPSTHVYKVSVKYGTPARPPLSLVLRLFVCIELQIVAIINNNEFVLWRFSKSWMCKHLCYGWDRLSSFKNTSPLRQLALWHTAYADQIFCTSFFSGGSCTCRRQMCDDWCKRKN